MTRADSIPQAWLTPPKGKPSPVVEVTLRGTLTGADAGLVNGKQHIYIDGHRIECPPETEVRKA